MVTGMKEMKDSGASWVGSIPSHWDVGRIDSFYTLRNVKVSDEDYPPLSVTKEGILPQLETAAKTNAHDDRKLVRKGDFAINSRSDRRGSCGISPCDGSVSLINTILAPKGAMNPEYYDWLFHTVQFADEFYKCGHGIVDDLWTTNYQDMKKINIPVPPIDEQQSIASYLNKQCAEIDALSADIQSEIDTLEAYKRSVITEAVTKGLDKTVPMKDSGISWIGKVPQNWPIYPLKYTFDFVAGATPDSSKADLWDGDVLWITPADYKTKDVYVSGGARNLSDLGFKSCSTHLLPIGTIVVSKRAPIGSAAITTAPLCTNQGCLGLIQKDKLTNGKYYYYVLSIYDEVLNLFGSGTTFKEISASVFGTVKVVNPSVAEQNAIVAYLDSKCAEIDSILAQKQEQLAVLADYKKSIIYEYVTGKKEVPVA